MCVKLKHLSNLMLLANFTSTLFYSTSYPYIYAETVKVVPKSFISMEQIIGCLSVILFCRLWNKYSDRLFLHYQVILWLEIIADTILFADVLIRGDLQFYFLFNVVIFALVTRNLICGITKLKAKVHPTEQLRERFDNNLNIVNATATVLGATAAMVIPVGLNVLFILALIGNIIDNVFYLYIYRKVRD